MATPVLTLYVRAGDPVAQHLLPKLVDAVRESVPGVSVERASDGVGWASCDLVSDRDVAAELRAKHPGYVARDAVVSPVILTVTTRPDLVELSVESGLAHDGPSGLRLCDAVVEVTLTSWVTDWTIVYAVHRAAVELWSAIPYAAQAGFDVTAPEDID